MPGFRVLATPDSRDLAALTRAEAREVAKDVKESARTAGDLTRKRLEAQTRANFRRPGGLVRAWKSRTYPSGRPSANAASVVWSDAPEVVAAFDDGATISAAGGSFLCIPTSFNLPSGRRRSRRAKGDGDPFRECRVKPKDMVASRLAFTIPRDGGGLLWMLKVTEAQSRKGRGQVRRLAFAGGIAQLGGGRGRRVADYLRRGAVPMFLLLPQVRLEKKLDLEGAATEGLRAFDGLLSVALGA